VRFGRPLKLTAHQRRKALYRPIWRAPMASAKRR
jgi:hypothetical protein